MNPHRKNAFGNTRSLFLGSAALAGGLLVASHASVSQAGPLQDRVVDSIPAAERALMKNKLRGRALHGASNGGSQPIAGTRFLLYAAKTSGYGQARLAGFGASDASGNGTIVYYCPSQSAQMYLVALGGDAGHGDNDAIGLSAALGSCSGLPSLSITVNEVTTVASVYALSQFLNASGQKPGTSAGNVQGLKNAMNNFASLADLATGAAQTSLPNGVPGTPPTQTVNTLANALLPCVESAGPASAGCTALFGAATPSGGSAPTTTLQAALNIARSPGANVSAVYGLADPNGYFQPALASAPHDWTVSVNYAGGLLNPNSIAVGGLAVDAGGNVWAARLVDDIELNFYGSALKLGPQGAQLGAFSDNGQMGLARTVAVDPSGQVWVAHSSGVSGLYADGTPLSGSPFSGGDLVDAKFVAADAAGNIWVTNAGSVTRIAAGSHMLSDYSVFAGGPAGPAVGGLSLEDSGDIWVADINNEFLVELSAANPAQQQPGSPHAVAMNQPAGVALDDAGSLWLPNIPAIGVSSPLTKLEYTGSGYTPLDFNGTGLHNPGSQGGIAVDGAGTVWVANNAADGSNGVVAVSSDGTPLAGSPYALPMVSRPPSSVAVDASGNLWVGGGNGVNVVQVIGAAAPVQVPTVGQPRLP